ncbi:tetraspanin [Elysia marginata]|uniref:Tetraspanin n=1 Tax=Elysia marginata TaxID=1093978 RepID=A0AAV4EHB3_9GAST|nr:tetraspanin [Elysia marginata]
MICLGAWTVAKGAGLKLFDQLLNEPSYMLIGTGVAMVLVGVYGCVVSVKVDAWALRIFMIVVIALFIVQVVLGGIGFFLLDDIQDEMSDIVRKAVVYYRLDNNFDRDEDMNALQIEFKCCGGHSFSDWEANILYSCNSSSALARCGVPKSCCRGTRDAQCGYAVREATEQYTEMFVYTEGCIVALLKVLKTHVSIVAGLAFSVSILEIICLILANIIIRNTVYHRKLLPSVN